MGKRSALMIASLLLAGVGAGQPATASHGKPAAPSGPMNTLTFHGDRLRTGWNSSETVLTPQNVAGGSFGPRWNSPVFDRATINGHPQRPHIYASPLYVDSVLLTGGKYRGKRFGVIYAATGAGWVYAIKAFDNGAASGVAPGTILWRRFLGPPSAGPDGGVALGVLSTPIIDLSTSPPRMYVASDVADTTGRSWRVFALDIGSGKVVTGWPVVVDDATVERVNQNPPATMQPPAVMSQRGALNLSPAGTVLYVPFGAYADGGIGWMVAINTVTPRISSAFSGAPSAAATANGGMWGSGGPAVDAAGDVYDTTGNSPHGSGPARGVWGNTLLEWANTEPLRLVGTYSPWNYCQMDEFDTDLGGSSPLILPSLSAGTTSTTDLVAIGGKQGNAYLVDRTHLSGSLTHRPPCGTDSSIDASLLPPGPQPQFGKPGPLNIFGPYAEDASNKGDFAKARTAPAYFRGGDGTSFVFFSGSTKVAAGQRAVKPPSVARARVVTSPGQPAYLAVDGQDSVLNFLNAGPPEITSNGSANPIVWVIDENQFRSQPLIGPSVAHPVLYAVDAMTMQLLWASTAAELDVGGKYVHPTIARGTVFVGTDRIQAFGLHP